MSKDANYRRIIGSTRWAQLALVTKRDVNYTCQMCGRVTARLAVHHVRPIEEAHTLEEMEARAFDPNNLQVLCYDCHASVHKRNQTHERHEEIEAARMERIRNTMNSINVDDCI